MNKKKMFYIDGDTPLDSNDKVWEQISLFKSRGYEVKFIDVSKNTNKVKKIISRLPFINLIPNLTELKSIENNTYIYIRYFNCNRKVIKALKSLRRKTNGIKIAIEIPTYPYDGEIKINSIIDFIKTYPIIFKDKKNRKLLYKYVDKIITFSDDKKIWGIKTINISNGVNLKDICVRRPKKHNSINLIAVAKFGFWHGYDRLIKGLGQYYQTNEKHRNVKLYLVGSGDPKVEKQYKELIKKYNLESKVIITGKKNGEDLASLYNESDIGIDSLGRHRSNISYNSTLKGKEYLAKGLPIVSGVKTELDTMNNFKYYHRVPANENPIDIKEIVDFYDSIYQKENCEVVTNNIRNFCLKNFNLRDCYQKVLKWYES